MPGLRCIFLEKLPQKVIYEAGTDQLVDLTGMELLGILGDENHTVVTVQHSHISVIEGIDTNFVGLQMVTIGAFGHKAQFSVYVHPPFITKGEEK